MQAAAVDQQSSLSWMFAAIGLPGLLFMCLAALSCFLLNLCVVLRGKGPMAATALILISHVPLLIGVLIGLGGAISSYTMVATSATTPRPGEVALGISTALVAPMAGIILMAPGYATAALGAFVRSVTSSRKKRD